MSNTISPDYDHVAIFKDHVSWVVGYEYIGQIGDGYRYKIHTDSNISIDAVFCRAANFVDVIDKAIEVKGELNNENSFWIIVEDYISESYIDWFIYTKRSPLVPFFMNVKSSIHYNKFTWNFLDGVIQEKINQMCVGANN